MKYLIGLLATLIAVPALASAQSGNIIFDIPNGKFVGTVQEYQNYLSTHTLFDEPLLGAGSGGGQDGSYTPVTGYQSRTTQYISAAATTIPVASTKDPAGIQISLGNISASSTVKVYLNLEPGTSKSEPVICTELTATSWTNCTRGVAFQSGQETASSTAVAHNAGATIIMTNLGQFYNQFVSVDGTQQINGVKTFKLAPISVTPVANTEVAIKSYVDGVALSGAPDMNLTTKGIGEQATATEIASSTLLGSTTAPLVITTANTTSSPYTTGKFIPVTQNDGKIDPIFIATSSAYQYRFTASTTFDGTTTTIRSLAVPTGSTQLNGQFVQFPSTQGASSTFWRNNGSGTLISDYENWREINVTSTVIASNTLELRGLAITSRDCEIQMFTSGVVGDDDLSISFNQDRGNNYTHRRYFNYVNDVTITAKDGIYLSSSSTPQYYTIKFTNQLDRAKLVTWVGTAGSGTTISNVMTGSGIWNNTSAQITDILFSGNGSALGADTRFRVMCSKN